MVEGLDVAAAVDQLPLKDMEGALLAMALLRAVEPIDARGDVRRAVELAGYLHRDATRSRRGTLPRDSYITHPLRNTLRLHRWGVQDVDVLVASLLHDTVEDAAPEMLALAGLPVPDDAEQTCRAALRDVVVPAFGERVGQVVAAVTNPAGPRPTDPGERAQAYRRHVLASVRDDVGALLVKTSDLYDNAGSLYHHLDAAPEPVLRRARKYAPLLGPLRAELARVRPLRTEVLDGLLADLRAIEELLVEMLSADGRPIAGTSGGAEDDDTL